MTMKEQILSLFYVHHLKQVQIAEHLMVSQPYVSKIVTVNERYLEEVMNRKDINAKNRKTYLKEYHENYIRPKNEDGSYDLVKVQHRKDVAELSHGSSLSDENFWKFNSSAFKYNDKKKRYELDKSIKTSNDVPKHICTNVKLTTQKYKKPCLVSAT